MSTEVKFSTRDPAPEKIQARHCDRHAVVYVRQSTLRQVEQNRESTRLQYGLADRACRLGWRREQIMVIDDDLGRSAASALNRPGFQRLVAEVGLGHVGLALGIKVSRLARSCRDWHQLLEMCALFDTLIGNPTASTIRHVDALIGSRSVRSRGDEPRQTSVFGGRPCCPRYRGTGNAWLRHRGGWQSSHRGCAGQSKSATPAAVGPARQSSATL